jgi:hypothetical protein
MKTCKNCTKEYLVGGYKYCDDCKGKVQYYFPRQKVPKIPKADKRKSFIKSLHRHGYKYIQIAVILKISRQRVEQILRDKHKQARAAVQLAKQRGQLKPEGCEYPGCPVSTDTKAHHPDYSKPLEVIWLCIEHHGLVHRNYERYLKEQEKERLRNSYRVCAECGANFKSKTLKRKYCHRADCIRSIARKNNKTWNYKDGLSYYMRNEHRRVNHKEYMKRWFDKLSDERKDAYLEKRRVYSREYHAKKMLKQAQRND